MTKKNKNNWTDRLRASVFPNPSKGKSKTLKKKKKWKSLRQKNI